jgi:hypothetical protein
VPDGPQPMLVGRLSGGDLDARHHHRPDTSGSTGDPPGAWERGDDREELVSGHGEDHERYTRSGYRRPCRRSAMVSPTTHMPEPGKAPAPTWGYDIGACAGRLSIGPQPNAARHRCAPRRSPRRTGPASLPGSAQPRCETGSPRHATPRHATPRHAEESIATKDVGLRLPPSLSNTDLEPKCPPLVFCMSPCMSEHQFGSIRAWWRR